MRATYEDDPGVRWMLAYRSGDEAAFDHIVRAYSGKLFALFTRFLGAVPEREDLVQEVFLRVIRSRERYEPSARFSTWLYRIAFNLAVNKTERASGEVSIDGATGAARGSDGPQRSTPFAGTAADSRADADPAHALERGDVVHAVRAAIGALPESQRMALILAKYEELPYAEIAVVLRSSEKAIKSMVHRARENLRSRLAPFLQQELP